MEFITQSTGKKRQMVFLPEANPDTFLLFFEKGNTGYSWSLRDYSVPNSMVERFAQDFGWSSSEVRQKARLMFDAPTVDVGQLGFWHDYTLCANALLKSKHPTPALVVLGEAVTIQPQDQHPILNIDVFRRHPKAAKRGDLDRMLHSPQSEDWVTWNLLNLLRKDYPLDWYSKI